MIRSINVIDALAFVQMKENLDFIKIHEINEKYPNLLQYKILYMLAKKAWQ